MSTISHGGRLDDAVARFGGEKAQWIDLSTGLNPNGYPIPEIETSVWQSLPDDDARKSAEAAVRNNYGVPPDAGVSMAPGSQAHIQTLPFMFKPQDVAIVGFTYQEHGVCWRRAGHEVFVTDGLESAEATARIVIVVNPNNPDGRIFDGEDLIELARRLAARGGVLVVDEAFADGNPSASVVGEAGRDGLIVLRSLGKFYGLGGVRFGALLAARNLTERLDDRLGPWAVSGPALFLAKSALADEKWHRQTRKRLADMREELESVLIEAGHDIAGSTCLFVLSRHARAEAIFEHLAKNCILVRSFPGKPDWIRFGMPASKRVLNRLAKTLKSLPD